MGTELFDEQFKILLIGESGVGKSSILLRYTEDTFDELPPTIGVDFKSKKMTIGAKRVKLTLWDTAGQERFRTLTGAYYRGAHGVVLVYDVTRRDTFQALKQDWIKELATSSPQSAMIKMVVGNKIDLSPRQVSTEEGREFSQQVSALFVESSAKTSAGVEATFAELVQRILSTPSLCSAPGADGSGWNIRSDEVATSGCSC